MSNDENTGPRGGRRTSYYDADRDEYHLSAVARPVGGGGRDPQRPLLTLNAVIKEKITRLAMMIHLRLYWSDKRAIGRPMVA